MKPYHSPFVAYTEDDVSPEAPRISLDIRAYQAVPEELSMTLPYRITFTLRRHQDGSEKPLICSWTPYSNVFANANLVLLHMTDGGPKRVKVDPLGSQTSNLDGITINGWNQSIQELHPGDEISMTETLTANYQKLLKPGEKYELLHPGSEIAVWDWGSKRDHMGTKLKSRKLRNSALPALILLAVQPIVFTAKEEPEPWPQRPEALSDTAYQQANQKEQDWRREKFLERNRRPSSPPISISERVAGAPILSVHINSLPEWSSKSTNELSISVTFEGMPDGASTKSITFHTRAFKGGFSVPDPLQLYWYRKEKWERIYGNSNGPGGFIIVDDPPVSVSVGDNDKHGELFVTLKPGETWTTKKRIEKDEDLAILPGSVSIGERFKCLFRGITIDWWDWGTKEDHSATMIKLPCWVTGLVEDPPDNNGRPKLVVPASNEIFCTYAGP